MARQNGNVDPGRVYMSAGEAKLDERVTNQGRRLTDIESDMKAGFRSVEASLSAFMNETRNSIAALSTAIAERNKPQWQALGVMLTFVALVGALAYWPIRESTDETKIDIRTLATETNNSIRMLAERAVTREELNWRASRSAEDRARMERDIAATVTRNEWSERNLSRDHEVAALREAQIRADENLQRQIDTMRSDFQTFSSSLGNGRDFIQDLKEEVNRIREQFAEFRARNYQQQQFER